MATVFVRHTVRDYAAWRKVYDEFKTWAESVGRTSEGVYQLDGSPNDLTVYQEFATMEAAKTFAASDELKEAMARAGVDGAPDIWFADRV